MFGSRNVKFAKPGEYNDGKVPDHSQIGDMFQDAADFVKENIDKEILRVLEVEYGSKLVLFGENMVKHTLDYDWDAVPQWLLFGVWHIDDQKYLDFVDVEHIADDLGVETVPLVDRVGAQTFKEQFDPDNVEEVIPESAFREGLAEGIVLRNVENGIKAKIHSPEFKEAHRSNDGQHGEEHLPGDDTAELVNMYATDGRIRKHIKKLTVDEGRDLEMKLMEELPMCVVEDIFEEEYEEIVRSNKTIHFKEFRTQVAKKCVSMLRAEMRKRASSGANAAEGGA